MITVCIPTIPLRTSQLARAMASIESQRLLPTAVVVEQDVDRQGAAVTRQRALERVETEWVAFLDDDDEMLPWHLETLLESANARCADYVYSWYWVRGGTDPRPEVFGREFDPCNPVQTTITTLVRTELAQACGFTVDGDEDLTSPDRHFAGEDWRFTKRCLDAGAHIVHAPYRTWIWHHWEGNTSGLPSRW